MSVNPISLNINIYGIMLGIAFAVSILNILWWMFHPSKGRYSASEELPAAELSSVIQPGRHVLVGVTDTSISERLIRLACGIAREYEATVNLIYVIEIPMTLPLNVETPDQVSQIKAIIAKAEEIGSIHKVKLRPIVTRARFAGKAIFEASQKYFTDYIVLGAKKSFSSKLFGSSADFILRNAECDVIVDRFGTAEKLKAN